MDGSIYFVLYYSAGWNLAKWRSAQKICQKNEISLKLHTTDCFGEKETGMQHSGIAKPSKHAPPEQMALHQHGCLLQKFCGSKAPTDLYNLEMCQVSYKERTKSTMVTKMHF